MELAQKATKPTGSKKKNKRKKKKRKENHPATTPIPGGRRVDDRIVTICYLKCPVLTKNYDTCNEIGKYSPYTVGKKQPTENVPEATQMLDLGDKQFKSV